MYQSITLRETTYGSTDNQALHNRATHGLGERWMELWVREGARETNGNIDRVGGWFAGGCGIQRGAIA